MKKKSVVVLLCIVVWLLLGGGPAWESIDRGELKLVSPSFVALAAESQAQEKGVDFLQQEAGISAYVKVNQAIDLAKVRGAFKTAETVSDEYLIGEVSLPELPEDAHPHVYVNTAGWIVAYYSKDEPASKIMQWTGYGGGPIVRTTLEDAIRRVYDVLQLPYPGDAKYYSFKYPSASRIMLVTEILEGDRDFFYLKIPQGLRLFEASWSHYALFQGESVLWIDDSRITSRGYYEVGLTYGDLTSRLKMDFRHLVGIQGQRGEGMALVLVY